VDDVSEMLPDLSGDLAKLFLLLVILLRFGLALLSSPSLLFGFECFLSVWWISLSI